MNMFIASRKIFRPVSYWQNFFANLPVHTNLFLSFSFTIWQTYPCVPVLIVHRLCRVDNSLEIPLMGIEEAKRVSCISIVPKWCETLWPKPGFKGLFAHCEDVDIIFYLCLSLG